MLYILVLGTSPSFLTGETSGILSFKRLAVRMPPTAEFYKFVYTLTIEEPQQCS